jgi:hypothetical protein
LVLQVLQCWTFVLHAKLNLPPAQQLFICIRPQAGLRGLASQDEFIKPLGLVRRQAGKAFLENAGQTQQTLIVKFL